MQPKDSCVRNVWFAALRHALQYALGHEQRRSRTPLTRRPRLLAHSEQMIAPTMSTQASSTMSPEGKVCNLISQFWTAGVMRVFLDLGIADTMAKAAFAGKIELSSSSIADLVEGDCDPANLYRVLRLLSVSSIDVVHEVRQDVFVLTDTGRMCTSSNLGPALHLPLTFAHGRVWEHATDHVRNGTQNSFSRVSSHGASTIFEYCKEDPAYEKIFNNAMSAWSGPQADSVVDKVQHSSVKCEKIVDVGGGHGLLCEKLAEATGAEAICFDLPKVVASAPKRARTEFVGGSFFDGPIPEGDLYMLKMVMHNWSDDECMTILKNIRKAAKPGSKLLVAESIVPPAGVYGFAKIIDSAMLTQTNGRERTREEFESMLNRAGFNLTAVSYGTSQADLGLLCAEVGIDDQLSCC